MFRDEPDLLALAVIVFFLVASAVDYTPARRRTPSWKPWRPEVRTQAPPMPPPMKPLELIRL